jgi:hypothetical protein
MLVREVSAVADMVMIPGRGGGGGIIFKGYSYKRSLELCASIVPIF